MMLKVTSYAAVQRAASSRIFPVHTHRLPLRLVGPSYLACPIASAVPTQLYHPNQHLSLNPDREFRFSKGGIDSRESRTNPLKHVPNEIKCQLT